MPKKIYKKTEKGMDRVGILPSLTEWNGKSNVGHTHAIKTLNTDHSSALPVSSSEAISGSGVINLHKVSKTGKFSDLSNRGEAFLSWGGQSFAGSYGPIDAAMIPDLGANRLAFMKPAGISVEYSRDSGTTWQDYGATDGQKLALTSTGTNFNIGKADSSDKATEKYMLRISLHTSDGHVYTQLNKFALYVSTNGSNGSYCTIRARTQDNYLNKVDKWDVFANKQSIAGWSGWNIINTSTITTFGNTASNQYGEIQLIFGCTSGSTKYAGLQIQRLMGFGGAGWTTPSTMAKTGQIYTYDTSQNVIFPKDVSAESFTENGKKLASKYAGISHTHKNYVTTDTAQTISGVKTFTAQPIINTPNGLKFTSGNCTLRIYNTSASPADYAAIEARSNNSTKRNLFIDLDINSLVVGPVSGTADTTYKVNVKDSFNATTIYEDGTLLSSKYQAAGNYAILDSNGKLADSVIPAVAITDTYVVANKTAMLALNAQKGDIAIRSDLNKSFVLQATPASTLANWKELLTPTDAVLSVNGKKGAVTLNLDDIKDGSTRKLSDYVTGPSSSTANAVPRYADTTGKTLKDSGVTISDANVLSAAQLSANIIETGTGDNNYFQSRKFRGEGNATTYYHAVDFGFAGHNQVDFYEYGGIWNFWKNQNSTPTTDSNNLCLQIGDTYVKNKNNTFTWPTTSGTLALTSNIPTAATAADNILHGSNNGMQITYAPYVAQQSKLSFDTSTTAPTRTDRLNLNGYLYATKFNVAGKAAVQYNSTEDCIEFIFA